MILYIQRRRVSTPFSVEEIEKLPPMHNARRNPDAVIERWVVDIVDLPPLGKIENKVDVILFGKDFKLKSVE